MFCNGIELSYLRQLKCLITCFLWLGVACGKNVWNICALLFAGQWKWEYLQVLANLRPCLMRNKGLLGVALSRGLLYRALGFKRVVANFYRTQVFGKKRAHRQDMAIHCNKIQRSSTSSELYHTLHRTTRQYIVTYIAVFDVRQCLHKAATNWIWEEKGEAVTLKRAIYILSWIRPSPKASTSSASTIT